ncbi:hypothetical protein GF325_12320 [Candidatus Bathyarchaeota archaeon]|nr:hypothetical protein [Candidatus Bathyarchaeota archaeon]
MDGNDYSEAFSRLLSRMNYIELSGDMVVDNLKNIVSRLGMEVASGELEFKCKWSKYKECNICTIDGKPMVFVKELWQVQPFREILGIHLASKFLDSTASFPDYLFGKWKVSGRKTIPVLITPYLHGEPLGKKEFKRFHGSLGKQYAFHEILSLYDVDWRHFIMNNEKLTRIDLGRCFANLDMEFAGFWDFKIKKLTKSKEFIEQYEQERDLLSKNFACNAGKIHSLLQQVRDVGQEGNFLLDLDLGTLVDEIVHYWKAHVAWDVFDVLEPFDN